MSFESIDNWMERIEENAKEDVQIVLAGTKADLAEEREVTKEEGKQKADDHDIKFFELSAR